MSSIGVHTSGMRVTSAQPSSLLYQDISQGQRGQSTLPSATVECTQTKVNTLSHSGSSVFSIRTAWFLQAIIFSLSLFPWRSSDHIRDDNRGLCLSHIVSDILFPDHEESD